MNILFVLGVVVALVMIAFGVYLFFFSRKSADQAAAEASWLESADTPVVGRAPIVPRALREMAIEAEPEIESEIETEYLDAGDERESDLDHAVQSSADSMLDDDLLSQIKPQATRNPPNATDRHPPVQPSIAAKPEPVLVPTREFVVTSPSSDATLDSMLDDLEQATAKLIPPVERGEVAEWQGDSALLNAHIEDQARRDDESTLAQAEQIVALYLIPTQGRSFEGGRVLSLLRQYGLRFGEMSLFHRFEESSGAGRLMFSVLRYTAEGPQGFDLENLPQERLEGLAFFLALPNIEAVNGYDMMASISSLLARDFSAQLYDEEMNPFTKQLKAHYRHVVSEFKPKG